MLVDAAGNRLILARTKYLEGAYVLSDFLEAEREDPGFQSKFVIVDVLS